ncbi:DUF3772 domain-containing protein [Algirhabdus cladophorae]|uniref:DUF3772 domain-containing protein n=1 Tax=Algirhabdus cladophorae TaxID=3377108 RepID=UPI003B84AC66
MILRILALLVLTTFTFGIGVVHTAHAQNAPIVADQLAPDYQEWEKTALRAEDVLETAKASNQALEQLRLQLVSWRERFLSAQDINADRIATLTNQLSVLGPAPEEPASEAEELTARRTELNTSLATARAPVVRAQTAYSRADGLIKELDQLIRARLTSELLYLGPTPLNPTTWFDGAALLEDGYTKLSGGLENSLNSATAKTTAQQRAPIAILLLLMGIVILIRARRWAASLEDHAAHHRMRFGGLSMMISSFTRVALPFAAILAIITAARMTGFFGPNWQNAFDGLLYGTGLAALIGWIGIWVFPNTEERPNLLFELTPVRAARARRLAAWLGAVMGVIMFLDYTLPYDAWPRLSKAVVFYPFVVILGYIWFRLGRLILYHGKETRDEGADARYSDYAIRMVGRGLMVAAVVAVVLGSIGYMTLAEALIQPLGFSFLVLGSVVIVTYIFSRLYARFTGGGEEAANSLIPVLFSLVAFLAALPFLALSWGARLADLSELLTRFLDGVQIGNARISPSDFLTFAFIFVVGYMLTRLLQGTLRTSVLPKTKMDTGGRNAVVSGVGYVGIFLAALIAITTAGIDLSSLAIVAGALSVGIGFGLQNIVSNFVSGIILLIERPIAEGDWIEVGGQMGYVRDISVRSTRIETFDRTDVIVPNADLVSNQVTNWTRGNTVGRLIVPVGVAYGTDTRWVQEILTEIARAHPMVLLNPAPAVLFMGFGADSLDFEIRVILRDVSFMLGVKTEMNHQIAERFTKEGIEIPFAQRDVWLRNPEVLQPSASEPTTPSTADDVPDSPDEPTQKGAT